MNRTTHLENNSAYLTSPLNFSKSNTLNVIELSSQIIMQPAINNAVIYFKECRLSRQNKLESYVDLFNIMTV